MALRAILATVGRNVSLVALLASPFLKDGDVKGSLEHRRSKKALQRYWVDFGLEDAAGDCMAFLPEG